MDRPTLSESVDILVVPRDRFSVFPKCLDTLYAHTDVPFRVIVVAGDVDTETQEYFRQLELQKTNLSVVLVDHLLMQGEARNIALRKTTSRFCVILENDTLVHKNWLAPMFQCMQEEGAAVVMPLIWWYGRIHAAGCTFEERGQDGSVVFRHRILYSDVRRKRIDYPECHCILIDRHGFPDNEIFQDVEPFDVDLGLLLRRNGLSVFFEPNSVVTYAAPPPLEVRDIRPYKFRWNAESWESRNRLFIRRWGVRYNRSSKVASYRRQYLKLGLARWFPNQLTVGLANLAFNSIKRLQFLVMRGITHDAAISFCHQPGRRLS